MMRRIWKCMGVKSHQNTIYLKSQPKYTFYMEQMIELHRLKYGYCKNDIVMNFYYFYILISFQNIPLIVEKLTSSNVILSKFPGYNHIDFTYGRNLKQVNKILYNEMRFMT